MLDTVGGDTNRTLSESHVGHRSGCVGGPATEGSNPAHDIQAIGLRNGVGDVVGCERTRHVRVKTAPESDWHIRSAWLNAAVFLEDRATIPGIWPVEVAGFNIRFGAFWPSIDDRLRPLEGPNAIRLNGVRQLGSRSGCMK
jgi:hypothetical protein